MPYKNPHGEFCCHAVNRLRQQRGGAKLVVYLNDEGRKRSRVFTHHTPMISRIMAGEMGEVIGVYDQSITPLEIADDLDFSFNGK